MSLEINRCAAVILVGLIGFAFKSHAANDLPIHVQADSAEMDDAKGIAIYRGAVIVTQGDMKIMGNTVTVTRSSDGEPDVFTAVGNPAYYEDKKSPSEPPIQATGLTMKYFIKNDQIVLIDQAKVTQNGNVITGEKIVYNTKTQLANAGRAQGDKVTSPSSRVNLILQPKKNAVTNPTVKNPSPAANPQKPMQSPSNTNKAVLNSNKNSSSPTNPSSQKQTPSKVGIQP